MSATGSGKTGSAIKHIDHLVTHGKCAIMVMQSYDLLKEAYDRLQNKDNAKIFKGKTQEDICPRHEELKELYKYAITGLCPECNKMANCEYYKQIDWIKGKRKEDKWICVFTVKENVECVLEAINSADTTIIVDDIYIHELVLPRDDISVYNLQQINDYLEEKKKDKDLWEHYFLLQEIVDSLLSDSDDIQTFENDYRIFGGDVYKDEIKDLSNLIKKGLWNKDLPDFRILYKIIKRLQDKRLFRIRRSGKTVIYTEDNTEFYQKYRILYLNVKPRCSETRELTPDCVIVDGYSPLFELLGEYHLFNELPPPNEKWVILQVNLFRNRTINFTKRTAYESHILGECIEEILALNDGISKCLGINCLLITNNGAYKKGKISKAIQKSKYAHDHEYHFGDGVRSTNQYEKALLCIYVGNPYLPSDYYEGPLFDKLRVDKNQVKDGKKAKYPVSKEITNTDSKSETEQGLSRVLRGDSKVCKSGIFFGDIEFDGRLSTNGAVVKPGYNIHDEDEKKRFLKDVRKELQRIYRQKLTERLCEEVESLLKTVGHPIKLDSFATEFIERNNLGKLYKSTKTIKKYIQEKFNVITVQEKSNKVAYIISKI